MSRDEALKLKRFEADEKARKAADLEQMIREFEGMASELDCEIKAEEHRTGIKDRAHFAYPAFAKSASQRRDNLRASANALKATLISALLERDDALEQLNRLNSSASSAREATGGV